MTLWESRSGADGGSLSLPRAAALAPGGFWAGAWHPSEGAQAGPLPAFLEALLQPAPPLGSSLSQKKPAPKGGGGGRTEKHGGPSRIGRALSCAVRKENRRNKGRAVIRPAFAGIPTGGCPLERCLGIGN